MWNWATLKNFFQIGERKLPVLNNNSLCIMTIESEYSIFTLRLNVLLCLSFYVQTFPKWLPCPIMWFHGDLNNPSYWDGRVWGCFNREIQSKAINSPQKGEVGNGPVPEINATIDSSDEVGQVLQGRGRQKFNLLSTAHSVVHVNIQVLFFVRVWTVPAQPRRQECLLCSLGYWMPRRGCYQSQPWTQCSIPRMAGCTLFFEKASNQTNKHAL